MQERRKQYLKQEDIYLKYLFTRMQKQKLSTYFSNQSIFDLIEYKGIEQFLQLIPTEILKCQIKRRQKIEKQKVDMQVEKIGNCSDGQQDCEQSIESKQSLYSSQSYNAEESEIAWLKKREIKKKGRDKDNSCKCKKIRKKGHQMHKNVEKKNKIQRIQIYRKQNFEQDYQLIEQNKKNPKFYNTTKNYRRKLCIDSDYEEKKAN